MKRLPTERPIRRGELARRAGCNIETLRYYEKIGLLPEPSRTDGGHRLYPPSQQARVRFILRGRALGFSIEELRNLLGLVDTETFTCGDVLGITRRHLDSIAEKIADLERLRATLSEISSQCQGGRVPSCPVIDALQENPPDRLNRKLV